MTPWLGFPVLRGFFFTRASAGVFCSVNDDFVTCSCGLPREMDSSPVTVEEGPANVWM